MSQLQRVTVTAHQITDRQISLTPEQQHYLSRVLRLRAGDRFIAIDGQGQWWLSELSGAAAAQILEPIAIQTELPIAITLLIALPKNGMDEVVRQATELGISRIVPVLSTRSLLKPSPQKLDRWQRIAQEATEQSERQIVPKILTPQAWTEALQTWNASNSVCFVCVARGDRPHLWNQLSQNLAAERKTVTSLVLAIGSEGGWTEAEVKEAIERGYQSVSLGARVLRAVTAPLVALSLIGAWFEANQEQVGSE
ncbi:MAG TPA: 16S rRNA (uracil(1498)-N(3))-methyltransferase [Trichocoleus sp.]|jgi:16S rRNA (uracil1498-N3)-methyltransferase